jgi:hypothetical protein
MKWIVLEDDLRTGDYIAVVATPEWRKLRLEDKPHRAFTNRSSAIAHASRLKEVIGAKAIRVFHQEGIS